MNGDDKYSSVVTAFGIFQPSIRVSAAYTVASDSLPKPWLFSRKRAIVGNCVMDVCACLSTDHLMPGSVIIRDVYVNGGFGWLCRLMLIIVIVLM
jgi:hypothetical protein